MEVIMISAQRNYLVLVWNGTTYSYLRLMATYTNLNTNTHGIINVAPLQAILPSTIVLFFHFFPINSPGGYNRFAYDFTPKETNKFCC